MNKYELALVVNAKAEDDVRTATVEKAKEYIARYGGVVTEVEDWGKKRLAYDIQHMREAYYYFIQLTLTQPARQRWRSTFVSWRMSSAICVFAKTHRDKVFNRKSGGLLV